MIAVLAEVIVTEFPEGGLATSPLVAPFQVCSHCSDNVHLTHTLVTRSEGTAPSK